MSSAVKEDFKQNEISKINFGNEKKPLNFKEWKSLKDSQLNQNRKSETSGKCFKPKIPKKVNKNDFNNDSLNGSKYSLVSGHTSNFNCSNGSNGFPRQNISGGIDRFNNINTIGNSFKPSNGFDNNLNVVNGDSYLNFSDDLKNFQGPKSYENEYNRYSWSFRSSNNIKQWDNFFTTNNVNPQRDMHKEYLQNPFQCEAKANRLLQEFDRARFSKGRNQKQTHKVNSAQANKPNSKNNPNLVLSSNTQNSFKEPQIYVPNPKGKQGGKPYIEKPKFPEPKPELTEKEVKQQWKEYRQAIKPFKNRDFYNAKRVVQRLSKKDPSELDEKQLIRLKNAQECMVAHKARLSEKYPNYAKVQESSLIWKKFVYENSSSKGDQVDK